MNRQGPGKIEWTDYSWSVVTGCSKLCRYCYAAAMARRFKRSFEPTCHPERLNEPVRKRKPSKIFVASAGDLFDPAIPDWYIFAVWGVMAKTPWHTYQVLTKQPARMIAWFKRLADVGPPHINPVLWRNGKHSSWVTDEEAQQVLNSGRAKMFHAMVDSWGEPPAGYAPPTYDWQEGPRWWSTVLDNLWLGVSVTNQADADERIPLLLQTPAAVRVVSWEPALGAVDFHHINYSHLLRETMRDFVRFCNEKHPEMHQQDPEKEAAMISDDAVLSALTGEWFDGWDSGADGKCIHWLICGSQTGPGAVPPKREWVESVRQQCQAAGVALFEKSSLAKVVDRPLVQEYPLSELRRPREEAAS